MFDDAFNLFYMMLLFICMLKKLFLSFHLFFTVLVILDFRASGDG